MPKSQKVILKRSVSKNDPLNALEFLAQKTSLSKQKLKDVMVKGGVWRKKLGKRGLMRLRRAQTELTVGDSIELYYDPSILSLEPIPCHPLLEFPQFGLWYKTAGTLSQGTKYGDHLSLLRQVEKIKGEAYLIHRLDREAKGIMAVAYKKEAATKLSALWREGKVKKHYLVEVLGQVPPPLEEVGSISTALDGEKALTRYRILETRKSTTLLAVEIVTGRYHQIRRHFDSIGHPVIGDPLYGKGNKNKTGLQLISYSLEFRNPFTNKLVSFALPDDLK